MNKIHHFEQEYDKLAHQLRSASIPHSRLGASLLDGEPLSSPAKQNSTHLDQRPICSLVSVIRARCCLDNSFVLLRPSADKITMAPQFSRRTKLRAVSFVLQVVIVARL